MRRRIIAALCGALWLAGCFKSVSYDTQLVLKPWMQPYNQGELRSLGGVRLYAYAVDTASWRIASYDDAAAGVLTSADDPSQQLREPYASGEPFGAVDTIPSSGDWVRLRLGLASAMVVAVDTQNRLYAYTQRQFSENFSPVYLSVTFQPWRAFRRYHYGDWTFVNEFYDPDAPKLVDYTLKPTVQASDHGEVTPLPGVAAYAYAVDTAEWRVASYDDALAGILTSKSDPAVQLDTPTYSAVPSTDPASDYWLRMTVADPTLMVVAVDPEHRLYGYAKQTVTPGGAPVEASVTFCPWRGEQIYVSGSWRMVDESAGAPDPENPDPENPDPEQPGNPENPAAQAKSARR